MTNQQTIKAALEAHLQAFPLAIDIAWRQYEPKAGVAYLSPKLSSCQRTTVGAGVDGTALYNGTYTISVRRPADEGTAAAGQIAAALLQHFARGQVVTTAEGTPVILLDASEQPDNEYGNWVTIPVVVIFTATAA